MIAPRAVTTTDALKCVGVLAFLIDHYGYFFAPGETEWRLIGRVASPIFFFLLGFARTRTVPWTWLAFGVLLTGLDAAATGRIGVTVNILLNFALLRFAVLPAVEAYALARPLPMAALVLACLPLIPLTDYVLEYGTGGWLWAFFGLSHRAAMERAGAQAAWMRSAIGATATGAYIVREIGDYRFDPLEAMVLVGLLSGVVLALVHFRRAALPWQPPRPMAALMRFCGRSSLEIYAITLFAMQLLAYALANGSLGG
jgi:hypothetical protein